MTDTQTAEVEATPAPFNTGSKNFILQ